MENEFIGMRLEMEQCLVQDMETRGFMLELPTGRIPGYQLRFRVQAALPQQKPIWSPWFFLREADMETLARTIEHQMKAEGHLSNRMTPGSSGPH